MVRQSASRVPAVRPYSRLGFFDVAFALSCRARARHGVGRTLRARGRPECRTFRATKSSQSGHCHAISFCFNERADKMCHAPWTQREDRMFERIPRAGMNNEPGRNGGRVLSRRDWLRSAGLASMTVAVMATVGVGSAIAAVDQRPGGGTRPGAGGPPSGDGGSGRPGKPPGAGGGAPDGGGGATGKRPGTRPPGTGGGPPAGGGDGAKRPGGRGGRPSGGS